MIIPIVIVIVTIAAFIFFQNRITEKDDTVTTTPPPPVTTEIKTVRMRDDGYEPANLTAAVGTTITFTNDDTNDHWPASNIHPTHEIYPAFDPKRAIPPGESWSFIFDKAGIWRWHDHLFPNLKGTITVEE